MGIAGHSPVFALRRAHLSCERTSPFAQIDHRQHRKCSVGVLGQAAISDLGKSPNALEHQKGVLNLGTHTGLAPIGLSIRIVRKRSIAPVLAEVC